MGRKLRLEYESTDRERSWPMFWSVLGIVAAGLLSATALKSCSGEVNLQGEAVMQQVQQPR